MRLRRWALPPCLPPNAVGWPCCRTPFGPQGWGNMVFGDVAALLGSIAVCMHLTAVKRLRNRIPLLLFVTIEMALASCITLTMARVVLYARLSTAVWDGLFGFVHREWAVTVICGGALMLFGWLGGICVTKYVAPVVVASFLALEPAVAVGLGVLMGVEAFPDRLTIGGCIIMMTATVVVSRASHDEDDSAVGPLVLDDVMVEDPQDVAAPVSAPQRPLP